MFLFISLALEAVLRCLVTFSYSFVVESGTPNTDLCKWGTGPHSQCAVRSQYIAGKFQGRVYQFARAATNSPRLGDLNNGNLFSHSPGGKRSKIKLLVGNHSFRGLSPWRVDGLLLLCLPLVFPLCLYLNFLFVEGHQLNWIRAHPNDPL